MIEINMEDSSINLNPAEIASREALKAVYNCLNDSKSFILEAGAGAGKTYSLIKSLQYLIKNQQYKFSRKNQKIACITFTNVAKDEIKSRIDRNPLVLCETVHSFSWSLICDYQNKLRELLPNLTNWPERITESGGIGDQIIEYSLGYPKITDDMISLHHDDVIKLTTMFMEFKKFRRIVAERFPVILIDEYQDTNSEWINSIRENFIGQPESPLFGFFGDHWQKIYGDGCGHIEHPDLVIIDKKANFRSVQVIVNCLNRMRPELPQFVVDPSATGSIHIFHTNTWKGPRRTGNHWNGDLPDEIAHIALSNVLTQLSSLGWNLSPDQTKILMLTHRVLASEQGYGSLPTVFRDNNRFTKKENNIIAYFVDNLEPAYEAFMEKRFGDMFDALGYNLPNINNQSDKTDWFNSMNKLLEIRISGTVGEVIAHLRETCKPKLPDLVENIEKELDSFDPATDDEIPQHLKELISLHSINYQEIIALSKYLNGHSPFETKHGVKGAEFENVLVVIGRGWNIYNFNEMLELANDYDRIPPGRLDAFERNRNLFYVVCSRPKKRLAILFTQELSNTAMQTVYSWFGVESVGALQI
jgi:DNA helicase II / ATP-dependent DNA helicase PcrA